jgi:hypothetical protein
MNLPRIFASELRKSNLAGTARFLDRALSGTERANQELFAHSGI